MLGPGVGAIPSSTWAMPVAAASVIIDLSLRFTVWLPGGTEVYAAITVKLVNTNAVVGFVGTTST